MPIAEEHPVTKPLSGDNYANHLNLTPWLELKPLGINNVILVSVQKDCSSVPGAPCAVNTHTKMASLKIVICEAEDTRWSNDRVSHLRISADLLSLLG